MPGRLRVFPEHVGMTPGIFAFHQMPVRKVRTVLQVSVRHCTDTDCDGGNDVAFPHLSHTPMKPLDASLSKLTGIDPASQFCLMFKRKGLNPVGDMYVT